MIDEGCCDSAANDSELGQASINMRLRGFDCNGKHEGKGASDRPHECKAATANRRSQAGSLGMWWW